MRNAIAQPLELYSILRSFVRRARAYLLTLRREQLAAEVEGLKASRGSSRRGDSPRTRASCALTGGCSEGGNAAGDDCDHQSAWLVGQA